MAYLSRGDIIWDGATFHVTWQCHNHSWLLQAGWAKQRYYDLLCKYKGRYQVIFHSHHFMDNHVHLSGCITGTVDEFSALFRMVNSLFAKTVNRRLQRRGQVVMDRFQSPVIQDDDALLRVMWYQDLNSYRARMVPHPRAYRWSSYRCYAYGEPDPLITLAPAYLALGPSPEIRQEHYRAQVEALIHEDASERRHFAKRFYIGDPDWVEKRLAALREKRLQKRLSYLARRQRLLSQLRNHSPP